MNLATGLAFGQRVETLFEGKGTVISNIGVGVVVQFDSGKTERLQSGCLKKIEGEGEDGE